MKLTGWFPQHVKPFRRGIYEVVVARYGALTPGYALWTGGECPAWSSVYATLAEAQLWTRGNCILSWMSPIWRGVRK